MSRMMTEEQVEDFLDEVLQTPKRTRWKGSKIQFCCTVHGESHPSAGIDIDYVPKDENGEPSTQHVQVFNCFSCGAKGSLPRLLYLSQPDEYNSIYEAALFLQERYEIEFTFNFETQDFEIKRYEDFMENSVGYLKEKKRLELPRTKLAPFKSGKETYKYFFDRGFTKDTMRKFMIGRDLVNETVTMPVFWEDDKLAGIIGRYIDPKRPKNMRFMVYEFPKGGVIFPLNHLEVIKDTIIMVEAQIDVMMMHQWGITNVVSTFSASPSDIQLKMIAERCRKLIYLFNPDDAGQHSLNHVKSFMKQYGVQVLTVNYPYINEFGKDPCEWGEELTLKVIASASLMPSKMPRL
jgi:DNA primase